MKKQSSTDAVLLELRAFGLAYPGAHTKSPWPGHLDLAVKDKTFAYLSLEGQPLGVGCKLPQSCSMALMLPDVTPMAYGLGKSGWVSATFTDGNVDIDMLKAWIDESYRAQAPKKLVASLTTTAPTPAKKLAKTPAKKPAKKPTKKRATVAKSTKPASAKRR